MTCSNFSGVYAFCFGNVMNRYSSKIVYFYLLSYSEADWESYAEEAEELHGEIQNFTASCFCFSFTTDIQCGAHDIYSCFTNVQIAAVFLV